MRAHPLQHVQVVVAAEGRGAGEQLIEQHAEGEEVGAGIHLAAAGLLGRHGMGGPHHHSLGREGVGLRYLGDAEIEDLGVPLPRDHHVLGLEVAVNEAGGVGRREPFGDLPGQAQGEAGRRHAVRQQGAQRAPLHVLQDDGVPVGVLDEVVDLDHGRVAQQRRRPCLAAEPLAVPGRGSAAQDAFDRDTPAQALVPGEEDLAHAALAEPPSQPVRADHGGCDALGLFQLRHKPYLNRLIVPLSLSYGGLCLHFQGGIRQRRLHD